MDFYHIKDDYIDYLKNFDNKVADNKKETRPYMGTVLEIDGIKYYAPFTSPKTKHVRMKNTLDFRKIDGGRLGAINFNNMIPVADSALIRIVINDVQDKDYKRLLQKQFVAIKKDISNIKKTANNLRKLIHTEDKDLDTHKKRIKGRCCNLPLLEERCKEYK